MSREVPTIHELKCLRRIRSMFGCGMEEAWRYLLHDTMTDHNLRIHHRRMAMFEEAGKRPPADWLATDKYRWMDGESVYSAEEIEKETPHAWR